MELDWNEIVFYAGILVSAIVGGLYSYKRKPSQSQDAVLTGVGFELGNRHQLDLLIQETAGCRSQLTRIADALVDKNSAGITDRLEDLAGQIERLSQEKATVEERQRRQPPRRR